MHGLVADIGGTNARFALVAASAPDSSKSATSGNALSDTVAGTYSDRELLQASVREYPVASTSTLEQAIRIYLDDVAVPVSAAVIAVAAPVLSDEVVITNSVSGWRFTQSGLKATCGLGSLIVTNDFAALAHALPTLADSDCTQVGPVAQHTSTSNDYDVIRQTPIAVIGPGTGLGVSAWFPASLNGQALVIQGEGGHSILRVTTEREYQLLRLLSQQTSSKNTGYVSAEHMLSGKGIEVTYQLLHKLDGTRAEDLRDADILGSALNGSDTVAVETMNLFCRQLGYCAGDVALTFGARQGVFIGGGIVPRMAEFFLASGFRDAFDARAEMTDYLQAIPIQLITNPYAALSGAANILQW